MQYVVYVYAVPGGSGMGAPKNYNFQGMPITVDDEI
jgi:hypothetical protein